jgi:hypothetical protein
MFGGGWFAAASPAPPRVARKCRRSIQVNDSAGRWGLGGWRERDTRVFQSGLKAAAGEQHSALAQAGSGTVDAAQKRRMESQISALAAGRGAAQTDLSTRRKSGEWKARFQHLPPVGERDRRICPRGAKAADGKPDFSTCRRSASGTDASVHAAQKRRLGTDSSVPTAGGRGSDTLLWCRPPCLSFASVFAAAASNDLRSPSSGK